jgi:hypothetical protein
LAAVLAVSWGTAPTASASLISSIAGGFNNASTSGSDVSFLTGSGVNYSPSQADGGTFQPLSLHMSGSTMSGSQISGFSLDPLVISTGADTVQFNFVETGPGGPTAIPSTVSLPFAPFSFNYGFVQANIASVVVSGPDSALATTLTADFNDFINFGGSFLLTYNGLNLTTSGASITAAPSGSFTAIANNASPDAPEPSSIVSTLTGALAFVLAKLAHQLHKKNSTTCDEALD